MPSFSGAIRAGRAFVELFADDSKLMKGLARAQARLRAWGASVSAIGRKIFTAGLLGAGPMALSTRIFAGFERQMSRVQALTGASGEQFDQLRQKALQLGETTVYTARQAAEAMSYFALAGYDVQKILTAIGPTLDLAAVGQMEVAQAADLAVKIMAGAGVEAENFGYAVDVLTRAMTTANTDLVQLGDAIKYVGPVAKAAGMPFETLVASIQELSNAGIQGQMAGTTMRGVILALTDQSEEARQAIEQLGVTVLDTSGNLRPLAEIIDDFNRGLEGMGTGEKLELIGKIFQKRQATGFVELLEQGGDALRELDAALTDAAGDAGQKAATQLDNLAGDATLLKSAVEGAAIAIGEALSTTLRDLARRTAEVARRFSEWARENRASILLVAKLVAGAIALGGALMALGGTFKVLAVTIGVVTGAAKALLATLTFMAVHPVIAAIAGMIAVLVALGLVLHNTAARWEEYHRAAQTYAQKSERARRADAAALQRLDELSQKQRLNNAEMEEAEKLITQLEGRYGELGITLNKTAGWLEGVAEAHGKVGAAMIRMAKMEVDIQRAELQLERERLQGRFQQGEGWQRYAGRGFLWGADPQEILGQIEVIDRKLLLLEQRKRALEGGDLGAALGGEAPGAAGPGGSPLGRIESEGLFEGGDETALRQRADFEAELIDRLHRLRIEAIEDERRRAIELLNHEYDQKLQKAKELGASLTLLEETQAREREAIEQRFAQQRREEEQRQAEARADYQADIEDRIRRLEIEDQFAGDERGKELALLEHERKAAHRAAVREHGLDPGISAMIDREFDLRRRLLEVDLAAEAEKPRQSVAGTFNALLSGYLGGSRPEERTAKATEQTAKNTKQIEEKLEGGLAFT